MTKRQRKSFGVIAYVLSLVALNFSYVFLGSAHNDVKALGLGFSVLACFLGFVVLWAIFTD